VTIGAHEQGAVRPGARGRMAAMPLRQRASGRHKVKGRAAFRPRNCDLGAAPAGPRDLWCARRGGGHRL